MASVLLAVIWPAAILVMVRALVAEPMLKVPAATLPAKAEYVVPPTMALAVLTGALTTVLPWPSAILLPVMTPELIPAPWPMTVELAFPPSLAPLPTTVEFWPPAAAKLPRAVAPIMLAVA